MLRKSRLMVPGPTPLSPTVAAAGTFPMRDERTKEFAALFCGFVDDLKTVLATEHDVLVFTSSTTGAFEGAMQNLFSAGDAVLIATNGEFGDRWVQMCQAFGLRVVKVAGEWGRTPDPAAVMRALRGDAEIVAAICVHCETSTGAVTDLRRFGQVTREVVTVVDSASGVGACDLRTDEWGLDVVVGGTQKALMAPPGLSFVSISHQAWERHRSATLPRFYFDWTRTAEAYAARPPRTPWTPAIGVLMQARVALASVLEEGIEARLDRHVILGRIARAGLRGMGLELLTPDKDESSVVTAAVLSSEVNASLLVERVANRHGVQLAGGQGPLAGKVVRLGHSGYVDALDVIDAVCALEMTLSEMRGDPCTGSGTAAAMVTANSFLA